MHLFSMAKGLHALSFTRLCDCHEHIPTVAKWIEDEWGYLRNKGVDEREKILQGDINKNLYIGFYAGQPVAMFGLFDHQSEFSKAMELMYVYVEKEYRGLGFGRQIIQTAKDYAAKANANLIFLDTLKPSLNRLYEMHDAKVIGEGVFYSNPTDVLVIPTVCSK